MADPQGCNAPSVERAKARLHAHQRLRRSNTVAWEVLGFITGVVLALACAPFAPY